MSGHKAPGAPLGRCYDAVVVIPGIMGSELIDIATGNLLWGASDPRWYLNAWTTGGPLKRLQLTEGELTGQYDRIRASSVLRFPAFARVFAGHEPYGSLIGALKRASVHPSAVTEFAYDWRLPVRHNAKLLADRIDMAHREWLEHPALREYVVDAPPPRPVQVVIVAHSMGGLLAWALSELPGSMENVRTIVTIGTPFHGSVKAAVLLNTGRGLPIPLPAHRPLTKAFSPEAEEGVRALASTLPGLHDLLPMYRCIDEGSTARAVTASDIEAIGGNRSMTTDAVGLYGALRHHQIPSHRAIVGTDQPTLQSFSITNGAVVGHELECQVDDDGKVVKREDRGGDGTVYKDAAAAPSAQPSYLPQQHGALAKSHETTSAAVNILLERDWRGPYLGSGNLGISAPDVAAAGQEWSVYISGTDSPANCRARLIDLSTGSSIRLEVVSRDDGIQALCQTSKAGVYRVQVDGSAMSAVSQLTLVF